jgi:UDP-glucose:(glucosyl)LPS alpha-1,2-glucosyltransferase
MQSSPAEAAKHTVGGDGIDPNSGTYPFSNGGTEQQYRALTKRLSSEILDRVQIICSRVRALQPNRKHVLWLHDLAWDSEVKHLSEPKLRKRFDKLVFVSQQQFQDYHLVHGVPFSESVVIRNAIEPIECSLERPGDRLRFIYHTTPHRGLQLLVPAFDYLCRKFPHLHLDVYSSFSLYGQGSRDQEYATLFDACRGHPNITYHGAVSNEQVRAALAKAHFFAYPSIWQETSCIAAIEAMSAGVLVICPDLGALSETVGDRGIVYRWHENQEEHLRRFVAVVQSILERYETDTALRNLLRHNQMYVKVRYSWETRIKEWNALFAELL